MIAQWRESAQFVGPEASPGAMRSSEGKNGEESSVSCLASNCEASYSFSSS